MMDKFSLESLTPRIVQSDGCGIKEMDEDYFHCSLIANEWKVHIEDKCEWADWKNHYCRIGKFAKLTLTDYEEEGVLSDRIVACCLSYPDYSPEFRQFALSKCDLSNLQILVDIDIIKYHHYLQYLDISNNKIEDLSPLSQLPFLMYLDASHNHITKLLNFKPPFNLTYANFSFNNITIIPDLSQFWSLKILIVNHNKIRVINGVSELRYLRILDLSFNKISRISNVENMRLSELHLQHNEINSFETLDNWNLKTLKFIRVINVARNRLTTLEFIARVENIEVLNASNNKIERLLELSHLDNLRYLVKLNLDGNPIARSKHYFSLCVHYLPRLHILDGEELTAQAKEAATTTMNRELHVSIKRANLLILQNLNLTDIMPLSQPGDTFIRSILVLVGLPGSGIKKLIREMCKKCRHLVKGVCYTTRKRCKDDEEGFDYYFISNEEFTEKLSRGEFLTVAKMPGGRYYGTPRSELTKGADKVLLFYMSFEAALMLKVRGYSPKIIFCMPKSEDTHLAWLKQKYYYYYDETDQDVHIIYSPESVEEALRNYKEMERVNCAKEIYGFLQDIINEVAKDDDGSCGADWDSNDFFDWCPSFKVISSSRFNLGKTTSMFVLDNLSSSNFRLISSSTENLNRSHTVTIQENTPEPRAERSASKTGVTSSSRAHLQSASVYVDARKSVLLSVLSDYFYVSFEGNKPIKDNITMKMCHALKTKAMLFFNNVLKERQRLLDFHCSHVGIFQEMVFSDDIPNAIKTLTNFLKRVIEYHPRQVLSFDNDQTHENFIKARFQNVGREIEHHLSTDEKQTYKKETILYKGNHSQKCLMKQDLLNNQ